jgi:hypothetical protein
MSNIKNITIAYNPNDFYYYRANFSDGTKVNNNINGYTDTKCSISKTNTDNCREGTVADMEMCYNKELCKNYENAKEILTAQTNHDGAGTRHSDTNADYNRELMKSYNLAIGSLGILTLFYFLYK